MYWGGRGGNGSPPSTKEGEGLMKTHPNCSNRVRGGGKPSSKIHRNKERIIEGLFQGNAKGGGLGTLCVTLGTNWCLKGGGGTKGGGGDMRIKKKKNDGGALAVRANREERGGGFKGRLGSGAKLKGINSNHQPRGGFKKRKGTKEESRGPGRGGENRRAFIYNLIGQTKQLNIQGGG